MFRAPSCTSARRPLVRIATRKSPLALCQAEYIKQRLQGYYPLLQVELKGVVTEGDIRLETSLAKVGGKGLFVKALEQAILDDQADMAVHSMKDMPMELPPGLILAVICQREDPRDVFISPSAITLGQLPAGARIGTTSLRRQMQLKALHASIEVIGLRGNVDTRLHKLAQGDYEAIILAAAGLIRLQKTTCITQYLPIEQFLPAVGQGALGIECRAMDRWLLRLLAPLNHRPTYYCVTAERAMSRRLAADCHTPVAAYATFRGQKIQLQGLVGRPDASLLLKASLTGSIAEREQLGLRLAELLLARGADKILQE